MGVQIDLPLSPAERDALLTHCSSSASPSHNQGHQTASSFSTAQGVAYSQPGGSQAGGQQVSSSLDCSTSEESRAQGRNHGEMLYQYQQQQYHLHQERISEAQMQQAYYSLSVAPQDTHSSQVGGSFEDLGCSAAHSLCFPDEIPAGSVPIASGQPPSSERGREVTSPASLQQQQLLLLQSQMQKQQLQQQQQMHQQLLQQQQQQQQQKQQQQFIKEEYHRQERSPPSSSVLYSNSVNGGATSNGITNGNGNGNGNGNFSGSNGQWTQRQPTCVSVDGQADRDADNNTVMNINSIPTAGNTVGSSVGVSSNLQKTAGSSSTFKKYDQQPGLQAHQQHLQHHHQQQQRQHNRGDVDHSSKNGDMSSASPKVNTNININIESDTPRSGNHNSTSSCDDEKGLTWYEDLSNTSSV